MEESNKIYIIGIHSSNDFEINKPLKLLYQPKNLSNHIEIVQDKTTLLYLPENEQEYILDFFMNSKDKGQAIIDQLRSEYNEYFDQAVEDIKKKKKKSPITNSFQTYLNKQKEKIY